MWLVWKEIQKKRCFGTTFSNETGENLSNSNLTSEHKNQELFEIWEVIWNKWDFENKLTFTILTSGILKTNSPSEVSWGHNT